MPAVQRVARTKGETEEKTPRPAPLSPEQESARRREVRELIDRARAASDPAEQYRLFEQAHRRNLSDPMAMSWHGMALATLKANTQQGIVFCEEAVRRMGPHPDLLVNLAQAYLAACNKREAVRALRRALARSPSDKRVLDQLLALGLRRPPVLPFLSRSNLINKYLGLMRHRVFYSHESAEDGRFPIPAELGQFSEGAEESPSAAADGTGEGA